MKRLLIILMSLIALTLLVLQAQAQQYQWGKPQAVQTPVAVAVDPSLPTPNFPVIKQRPERRLIHPKIYPHPASLPMPQVRKIRWEPICPVAMPTPLTVPQAPSSYVVVDAKILWQKAGIGFHRDELNLSGMAPVGEFGVSFIKPDTFKIRYGFAMQQSATESLIPQSSLTISNTVFVAPTVVGQPAAAPSIIPIKVDWQVGPSHRIDAICLRVNQFPTNLWLSPAIVANWMDFQVTGTTTVAPITAATETFNNFYWGGGLEAVYQQNNSRLSALVAGSDKYLMADTALAVALGNNFDLTAGWQGKRVQMERDTTMRLTTMALGLQVRF
jgi:hypothetical protein